MFAYMWISAIKEILTKIQTIDPECLGIKEYTKQEHRYSWEQEIKQIFMGKMGVRGVELEDQFRVGGT